MYIVDIDTIYIQYMYNLSIYLYNLYIYQIYRPHFLDEASLDWNPVSCFSPVAMFSWLLNLKQVFSIVVFGNQQFMYPIERAIPWFHDRSPRSVVTQTWSTVDPMRSLESKTARRSQKRHSYAGRSCASRRVESGCRCSELSGYITKRYQTILIGATYPKKPGG